MIPIIIFILFYRDIYSGQFLSKVKTGKNLKGDLKKGSEKGEKKKKEKSDKTHVKIFVKLK